MIACLLADQVDYANTTYMTIVYYVIYFSVFAGLFYLDNKKYRLDSGATYTAKLRHDLKKINHLDGGGSPKSFMPLLDEHCNPIF